MATAPEVGSIYKGYKYLGGNPSDKNNWEKAAVPTVVPQTPQEPGIVDRFKSGVKSEINAGTQAFNDPNISAFSRNLQGVGHDVAAIPIGLIDALVPPKKQASIVDFIKSGVNPDIKPVLKRGVQQYGEFSQEHPEAAGNINAALNITGSVPVFKAGGMAGAKGLQLAGKGTAKAVEGTGAALKKSGLNQLQTIVKPGVTGIKKGFEAENILKHDLGYTLPTMIKSADAQINKASNELKTMLADADKAGARADANELFVNTWNELVPQSTNKTDFMRALTKEFNAVEKDMGLDGQIPLSLLNRWRSEWGKKGKFERTDAPNISNQKQVYNTLYRNARQAIDNAVPDKPHIKELNQVMSELIPLKQSINKAEMTRILQNKKLTLTDWLLLAPTIVGGSAAGAAGGIGMGGAATGTGLSVLLGKKALESTPAAMLKAKTGAAMERGGRKLSDILQGAY